MRKRNFVAKGSLIGRLCSCFLFNLCKLRVGTKEVLCASATDLMVQVELSSIGKALKARRRNETTLYRQEEG